MLKCWNVSSPRLPGRHFLLLNEDRALDHLSSQYLPAFAKLETPSHAPVGRKHDLTRCDNFNQSEVEDRHSWPIRGLVWETWTNGTARKGNARKLWWSSFFLYYWVYLLSSEPWMGLELPLSWHLSFSSRWSSWYLVTQNCREKYKQIRSNNFTARATMKAVLFNKLCLGIIGRLKIYSSIILTPITDHCIHLLAPSWSQGVT